MVHSILSSSSSFLPISNHPFDFRSPTSSISPSFHPFPNSNLSKNRKVVFAAPTADRTLQASWFPPDRTTKDDDYGGWAIIEPQIEQKKKKKDLFPGLVLVAAGASAFVVIAAIAYSSLSRKGFRFHFNNPLHAFQRMLISSESSGTSEEFNSSDFVVSEATSEYIADETSDVVASASSEKLKAITVPVAADSTQQEAVQFLKKLKIIEDDVGADELCTRREYARWLVKLNSALERNTKHRLVPSMLLSGSVTQAFDDLSIEDPDFWSIQALAESGIVLSKLSTKSSNFLDHDDLKDKERIDFSPESFISRLDLVSWKAQLEYSSMPGRDKKVSMKELGFTDVKVSRDTSSGLFMDILAGDKSILRKVFGNIRRLQLQKPVTNAQAAVALVAGRMTDAIHSELTRLEAENSARLAEVEEIRSELLLRGDIQRVWEDKLNEVTATSLEALSRLNIAIHDLEQAKIDRDKDLTEKLKEKTALECQKQLLLSLKEDVNEMSERLALEKANFSIEQQSSEKMSIDFRAKQEAITEAKSILEAEKEALRILRTWIEDEARKSQARAQVLEQVGRRWKWNDEA